VKKLISIGVVLALLALVVVPAVVAAYEVPDTYSKVPFAILASMFYLGKDILQALVDADFLPDNLTWLPDLMPKIGDWAMGPLSWSVDMLAWGLELGSEVWTLLNDMFDIGMPEIAEVLSIVSCKLLTCWADTNCTGTFVPCA